MKKESGLSGLPGYHVKTVRHGLIILETVFPEIASEITEILKNYYIYEDQIIKPGGGKSPMVKALEKAFKKTGWEKRNVDMEVLVDKIKKSFGSHEIDLYKEIDSDSIGVEIEWNNKNPFYERDLYLFQELHRLKDHFIGILITRGPGLEATLYDTFYKWAKLQINNKNIDVVMKKISDKKRPSVKKQIKGEPSRRVEFMTKAIVQSKYGTATTNWNKLMPLIDRNHGYPTPLILIGICPERVKPYRPGK